MIFTVLIILLVLVILGGGYGVHVENPRYIQSSGLIGLLLIILLILALTGNLGVYR